jgi:hypothetical protein
MKIGLRNAQRWKEEKKKKEIEESNGRKRLKTKEIYIPEVPAFRAFVSILAVSLQRTSYPLISYQIRFNADESRTRKKSEARDLTDYLSSQTLRSAPECVHVHHLCHQPVGLFLS